MFIVVGDISDCRACQRHYRAVFNDNVRIGAARACKRMAVVKFGIARLGGDGCNGVERPVCCVGQIAVCSLGDGNALCGRVLSFVGPAVENKAKSCRVGQRDGIALDGIGGRVAAVVCAGIQIVGDVVCMGLPLRIERHVAGDGNGLFVAVTCSIAVGLGIPACKVIARAGECVGSQVLRDTFCIGLGCHGA